MSALQYARVAAWGNQTGPSGEHEPWSSERVVARHSKTGPHSTPAWDAFVQALAEGRRDVCDTLDAHDRHGTTALHFAAHAGAASVVRALIAAGASLDPRTQTSQIVLEIYQANRMHACGWQEERGWTPLLVACRGGHHECVSALVAAGASVHASVDRPPGFSTVNTLTLSAEMGSLRSLQLMLDAGASARVPPNTWSPLHAAIFSRSKARYDCAAALLRAGADANALDHVGRTPLSLTISLSPNPPAPGETREVVLRPVNSRLMATLLRKGARLPAPNYLNLRAYTLNVTAYIDAIRRAGGYARYETMRRAPFITALTRCGGFPIPDDMISIVVGFWVRSWY